MKEKSTIEKAYARPKKGTMPTLLKFQNGKVGAISKDNTKFCRVEQQKGKKAALVVATDQIYHGPVDASEAEELTDTYICVRNRATNKVRIIPIEQARLNNHIYNTLAKTHINALSVETTKKLLLKQFGGRKAARYAANQENMKIDVDLVKEELDATVQETTLNDTVDSVQSEVNFDAIRPKFNKEATQLHEVYDVHDVVPAQLLERLEEEAKVVYATPVDKLPIASEYLQNAVKAIQASTPSTEGFTNIKLIIYMDSLLNLVKSRVRSLKCIELSRITEKVENDVRTRFTDPNGKAFSRTSFSTEKALCHFIVLSLLINEDYSVDINILARELGTPKWRVQKFAQLVNARLKSKTDLLTLRLPSTVPALPTNMGRRGKK